MTISKEKIHEVVEQMGEECSERQKAELEQMIELILHQKVPYAEVLKIQPEVFEAIYGHAYRLYNTGNFHSACILFAYLASLNPREFKYHMGQAACHHMMKEYGRAVDGYMACYYIDMTNPLPFYHIADCCLKEGDFEVAYICLGLAEELAAQNPKYVKIKERAQLMKAKLTQSPSTLEKEQEPILENGKIG